MNIVVLAQGRERFIFIFGDTEADRAAAIQSAGRMADDYSLPAFSWYAAALVTAKIRACGHAEQAAMN